VFTFKPPFLLCGLAKDNPFLRPLCCLFSISLVHRYCPASFFFPDRPPAHHGLESFPPSFSGFFTFLFFHPPLHFRVPFTRLVGPIQPISALLLATCRIFFVLLHFHRLSSKHPLQKLYECYRPRSTYALPSECHLWLPVSASLTEPNPSPWHALILFLCLNRFSLYLAFPLTWPAFLCPIILPSLVYSDRSVSTHSSDFVFFSGPHHPPPLIG